MQGDSGRLGLAWITAEAGSIDSHIAPRTGEPAQPSGDLLLDSPGGARKSEVTTRELLELNPGTYVGQQRARSQRRRDASDDVGQLASTISAAVTLKRKS